MKNLFFTFILAWMVVPSNAQTPLLKPAEFSASLGMSFLGGGKTGNYDDYFRHNPSSSILKQDYSSFNNNVGSFYQGSSNGTISTGFYLRNKDKSTYNENRILRLGISFGSSSSFANSYYKHDVVPYDTFTSNNGTQYPIDSNRVENLSMSVEATHLLLDAALIFRTSNSKRWKLFAGLGLQAGMNFNGKAMLVRTGSSYLSLPQGGYIPNDNERSSNWTTEAKTVRQGFTSIVYIPLGIDWQTGTEKPFFRDLHIFYEMRPSLSMVQHSGFGTEVKTGLNQMIGVRVNFTQK